MADKFRYSKDPVDDDIRRLQRETEDNFFSKDKNGDLVLDKDIRCRSLYVEGESFYLGGIKLRSPIHSDDGGYWKYNRVKKQFDFTATASPITEEVQDIIGAMVTGNTETLIAVTYQDGDGTIDFVVDEANIDHDALTNFVTNEHLLPDNENSILASQVFG